MQPRVGVAVGDVEERVVQRAEIAALLGALERPGADRDPATRKALDALAAGLSSEGDAAAPSRRHVEMAKAFLFGMKRESSWRDPYVPAWIPVVIAANTLYVAITKKPFLAACGGAAALIVLVLWRRRRNRARAT